MARKTFTNEGSGRTPLTGAFRFSPTRTFDCRLYEYVAPRYTRPTLPDRPRLMRLVRGIRRSSSRTYRLLGVAAASSGPGSGNDGLRMLISRARVPSV